MVRLLLVSRDIALAICLTVLILGPWLGLAIVQSWCYLFQRDMFYCFSGCPRWEFVQNLLICFWEPDVPLIGVGLLSQQFGFMGT